MHCTMHSEFLNQVQVAYPELGNLSQVRALPPTHAKRNLLLANSPQVFSPRKCIILADRTQSASAANMRLARERWVKF